MSKFWSAETGPWSHISSASHCVFIGSSPFAIFLLFHTYFCPCWKYTFPWLVWLGWLEHHPISQKVADSITHVSFILSKINKHIFKCHLWFFNFPFSRQLLSSFSRFLSSWLSVLHPWFLRFRGNLTANSCQFYHLNLCFIFLNDILYTWSPFPHFRRFYWLSTLFPQNPVHRCFSFSLILPVLLL